jgi:hypothetical protein
MRKVVGGLADVTHSHLLRAGAGGYLPRGEGRSYARPNESGRRGKDAVITPSEDGLRDTTIGRWAPVASQP